MENNEVPIPGAGVKIPTDNKLKYIWIAELDDGSVIPQFSEHGTETLYGSIKPLIDEGRVTAFHFVSVIPLVNFKVTVELDAETRPIIFRRHRQKMADGAHIPHSPGHEVEYCIGFQRTCGGQNSKSIMFIDENGNVTLKNGD